MMPTRTEKAKPMRKAFGEMIGGGKPFVLP